jgi:hypothetical protein
LTRQIARSGVLYGASLGRVLRVPIGRDDVRAAVLCGCEHAAGFVSFGLTR